MSARSPSIPFTSQGVVNGNTHNCVTVVGTVFKAKIEPSFFSPNSPNAQRSFYLNTPIGYCCELTAYEQMLYADNYKEVRKVKEKIEEIKVVRQAKLEKIGLIATDTYHDVLVTYVSKKALVDASMAEEHTSGGVVVKSAHMLVALNALCQLGWRLNTLTILESLGVEYKKEVFKSPVRITQSNCDSVGVDSNSNYILSGGILENVNFLKLLSGDIEYGSIKAHTCASLLEHAKEFKYRVKNQQINE